MDCETKKSKMSMVTSRSTPQTKSLANVGGRSMGNVAGKSTSKLKVKKGSFGFGAVPGIKTVDCRGSQLALEFKRPPLMYLNTYQLDPRVRFNEHAVMKIVNNVLDQHFNEHKYNIQESPATTMRISGAIMKDVKALGFNRYRIMSIVTMAQKRAQSYNNAIAFLWDHERDSYVDTHREVTSAFIQVTVFGVYLD